MGGCLLVIPVRRRGAVKNVDVAVALMVASGADNDVDLEVVLAAEEEEVDKGLTIGRVLVSELVSP